MISNMKKYFSSILIENSTISSSVYFITLFILSVPLKWLFDVYKIIFGIEKNKIYNLLVQSMKVSIKTNPG